MELIENKLSKKDLHKIAAGRFGNMVKAVVDIRLGFMVIDADLHADEEAYLISRGSRQADLWGINLYPDVDGDDFIEFDSMINLRPSQGNSTRAVEDIKIQKKIRKIVDQFII